MFKKVLQSLTKSFARGTEAPKPTVAKKPEASPSQRAGESASPAAKVEAKQESALKKIVAPPGTPPPPAKTPEEMCGIEPKMNKDQIKDRLKLLYRRYNRAASSLDNQTRSEADAMLDAIVAVREKTFGEI